MTGEDATLALPMIWLVVIWAVLMWIAFRVAVALAQITLILLWIFIGLTIGFTRALLRPLPAPIAGAHKTHPRQP